MTDFQNAVIPQWVGRFLRSTPEMKATDAYVPFLLSKPLNKNEILELSWDINWGNFNCDSPLLLIQNIFKWISLNGPKVDFIVYTGDSPGHHDIFQTLDRNIESINTITNS